MYRHIDTALIRAAAQTSGLGAARGHWAELGDEANVEEWCGWLAWVWEQASVAEAVTVASPVLAARVEAVCEGQRPGASQVRRMVMSLARYLVRMHGRATPFGMFAGVAPLRFGWETSASGTGSHTARSRADATWLAEVIARLESCAALRRRLPVVVNDLVFVRCGRAMVPWQPQAGRRSASTEVSVRYTPAVQTSIEAARVPIRAGDLVDKLVADFPDAPVSVIEGMVADLVACGFLITSLCPPSTNPDGLTHVLARLDDLEAGRLAEIAPLVRELRMIHAQLATANDATCRADGRAREAVRTQMRALSDAAEQPLKVDLLHCGAVVLPPHVAAEAESAASALVRLAPHPGGHPAWQEYRTRFLDRYGVGALVPVDQLVDTTAGLGFPAHYNSDGRQGGQGGLGEMPGRDQSLLVLAQQAALEGAREIVLDDDMLDDLAVDRAEPMRPVPHAELLADVRAPTLGAVADGAFTLAVLGVGRTALAMTGRFLDLLPVEDRRRMVGLYGQLPVGVDGAAPAQLSFPPRYPRLDNVARVPRVLPEMISLAEQHDGAQARIPLRELAITADNDGLYVVSLSRRRVVEPLVTNAVALQAMPPIARLLFEIPRARTAVVSPFSWGAASCLPFLPRVRYGRSVLAPAQWRLPASELPGPQARRPVWAAAMVRMRERLRLPTHVFVGTADRHLRLNLDEPMDLTLLRAHLDQAASAEEAAIVWEAPAPVDHGWFAGRAHEVVVPLAATTPPARAPAVVKTTGSLPMVGREHGMMPGSRVLSAKLYGHPDGFDTILTSHLPTLLSAWEEPPLWWFVRYRDPSPHLRLRLHLASGHDYGQAAIRVGEWATELRRCGLVGDLTLDTYYPETARYGSGAALAAAEAVFAADSQAVLAQLATVAAARRVYPHALTAASLIDLTSAMTGGGPAGMRWLIDHPVGPGGAPAHDRAALRQAINLADPDKPGSALHALPGGPQVAAAWQKRRRAAAAYTERLAADANTHVRPAAVVASLLHMHHVRAHGTDPESEQTCGRLARAIALAWSARHTTPQRAHP